MVRPVDQPFDAIRVALEYGLDPAVRATVISMSSQAGALGEASAGPVVGAIGNIFGVRQALTTAAFILSPTLLLYGRAIKRGGAELEDSAPEK